MSLAPPLEATAVQAAIWISQQLLPNQPVFNVADALTIRGQLRIDLFERALHATVAECPGLRFSPLAPFSSFALTLIDLRHDPDPQGAAASWMQADLTVPIPLDGGPAFRFALLRIADDHAIWFQAFHHIVIDAIGRKLFSARTASHYRALRDGGEMAPLQCASPATLAASERAYLHAPAYRADQAYWLASLAHQPDPLVEADRAHSETARSGRARRTSFTLSPAEFATLNDAARALGASAFGVIATLTHIAFARLTDRWDIVLGVVLAGRVGRAAKQTIGLLSQQVPVRLSLDRASSLAGAIRDAERVRARDYRHRRFPLRDLHAALGTGRQGRNGLFDVILNYIPITYDFAFEQAPVTLRNLTHGFMAPWTVSVVAEGAAGDLVVDIDTDPGLIGADAAACFVDCLRVLLTDGLRDLACPVGRLPIMTPATRGHLLELAAGPAVALPPHDTLATLFIAQAARTPDAVALIGGQQQRRFGQLQAQASTLARHLAAQGVRPGLSVGIALPRTPALVVAVLGVLQAGAAYLPLDPEYPAERIRFIVADSATPIILTTAALAPAFAESGARVLVFDEDASYAESDLAEPIAARPDDLAYVLYTSGSTGLPKAVGVEHRQVVNLISWGRSVVSNAELGGILFSTSLNFDLSAFELFLPLSFGGCIVMVANLLALPASPTRHLVRLVNSGPSLLATLLRTAKLPGSVTTVIVAGERLPRHLADRLFETAPGIRFLNCYGPTETTVYSAWHDVDPAARAEPPIGRPLWNTTVHVLDSEGALLPPGAAGELYIGGDGVARGYLGRPELTAARFLPDPFASDSSKAGRLYRTGDRVRWLGNGEMETLGRADDQIKLNGLRIEPGEIEAPLLRIAGIAAAAVVLHEGEAGTRRLVAYLVAAPGASPEADETRAALLQSLPRHMVPSALVWLDAMPLTPNGKIDRKAFPPPPREMAPPHANRQPETELERRLAAIWADVLQVAPPGIEADFFDLGGDSLALLNLFVAIEVQFHRQLSVGILAGGLTISQLARLLAEDELPKAGTDCLLDLQPHGAQAPFFCVHSVGGDALHLRHLAARMPNDRPFVGLRSMPGDNLSDSVEQIAARYVAALLRRQTSGPFFLGGYSFGAVIAYEMARQLQFQGHRIALLAVIDTGWPTGRLSRRNVAGALRLSLANLPGYLRDEAARFTLSGFLGQLHRTLRGLARKLGGLPLDAASVLDLSRYEPEMIPFHDAHLRAMQAYRPIPSPMPVHVFRASIQPLRHPCGDLELGWGVIADNKAVVHRVPGNHLSITMEPLVAGLAAALSGALHMAESALAPLG